MDELHITNEIEINAPLSKIWDVLTNPKISPQYMFGCEIVSDWTIGSTFNWRGLQDGVNYVTGFLVDLKKEKLLSFTTFDPNASYPDIRENHLTATYTLRESGDSVLLAVTQGDYNTVAEGEKRYNDTLAGGGWQSVLESIKKIAEQG